MDTMNTQSSHQDQNISSHQKKMRQGRRNEKQLSFLVDYMVQHPHVATGKFNSLHGRDTLRGSWDELVVQLNALRNPGVKEKDVKSWKESWRDLKTKVSKQAVGLRNAKRLTGNQSIAIPELNEREKKVLGLMGYEYVEGTKCPDSFPENQPDDVERLAAGDYSILLLEPENVSIQSVVDVDSDLNQEVNSIQFADEFELEEPSFIASPPMCTKQRPSASSAKINSRKRKLFENQNTKAKKNLRTQLGDARETFERLAENNAQHLNNLSQAVSQLASAMARIAENDERRLQNEESMLAVMKQLVEKIPHRDQ